MNIDQKLEELRERYKNEPKNRKIIEVQAKLLKLAMNLEEPKKEIATPENVKDVFEPKEDVDSTKL
jgi:hypothetical protein